MSEKKGGQMPEKELDAEDLLNAIFLLRDRAVDDIKTQIDDIGHQVIEVLESQMREIGYQVDIIMNQMNNLTQKEEK